VARAQQAWPKLRVSPERYVQHLAAQIGSDDDVQQSLGKVSTDLYVACACIDGNDQALAIFDSHFLRPVTAYVARVNRNESLSTEVEQVVRAKLLLGTRDAQPLLATYRGRAPLGAWLRVVAVRTARSVLRSSPRDITLRTNAGPRAPGGDPETQLLKARHRAAFDRALASALAQLPSKDKVLLRLYFVESASLASLARMYHVHESTLSRRLSALRADLAERVRSELKVGRDELESIAALVLSQVDAHLSRL
jgi:RNA polymerase sigma-70 factor (ECF subfamily)